MFEILNEMREIPIIFVAIDWENVINATKIALKHLKAPIVNTAMIGAVVAVLEKGPLKVTLNKVIEAVKDKFGTRVAEVNINAIKEAYEEVSKVVT